MRDVIGKLLETVFEKGIPEVPINLEIGMPIIGLLRRELPYEKRRLNGKRPQKPRLRGYCQIRPDSGHFNYLI
jgi:hypothetical protein